MNLYVNEECQPPPAATAAPLLPSDQTKAPLLQLPATHVALHPPNLAKAPRPPQPAAAVALHSSNQAKSPPLSAINIIPRTGAYLRPSKQQASFLAHDLARSCKLV